MKKLLAIMLMAAMLLSTVPAMAAKEKTVDPGTNYSMDTKNAVVLQNVADRAITPQPGQMDINPIVEGESPTTGMPYDTSARYMPMLV